jgi:hypothetical protein
MATSKRHPHTAMPSVDELRDVIARVQPQHEALYLAVHRLVLETVPDVRHEVDLVDGAVGYGARQYGYGGWGMAALQAHKGWVSLFFMQGAKLDDPEGVLEGSGTLLRHVKVRSEAALAERATAIRSLLTAAARLHQAGA